MLNVVHNIINNSLINLIKEEDFPVASQKEIIDLQSQNILENEFK